MDQILDKAYQGLVDKASPTGLLPIWNKWVDKKVVAKLRLLVQPRGRRRSSPPPATRTRTATGSSRTRTARTIDLKIICPNGWSDWMTAIQVIADSAKAVGIKITPGFPDYGTLVDDRGHATFDLVLANDRQYSNTPWTYYQYIFHLPILENQTTVNYERFQNQKAWNLTQQLDKTPSSNTKAYQAMMSQAPDDVPSGSACDPALVQRHVGDVQHEVLDELAVATGRTVHAHLLGTTGR